MVGESDQALPEELRRWVDERAAESDEDAGDVLARAVTLYRLVEEHATGEGGGMPPVDGGEFDLERLAEQVSTLDGRVEAVEDDLEQKVTDVRERVIQVKRESDAKAPEDHGHEEYRDRLDRLETRLERGFDNYEEVLTYLTEKTDGIDGEVDDLEGKLTRLAQVVVSMRRRTAEVERQVTRLDAAADLKQEANRNGVTKAKCQECGGSVAVALLVEPACPHCESGFVDVEPGGRLFGSGTLVTGRPPALVAGDEQDEPGRDGRDDDAGDRLPTDIATEVLEESKNV